MHAFTSSCLARPVVDFRFYVHSWQFYLNKIKYLSYVDVQGIVVVVVVETKVELDSIVLVVNQQVRDYGHVRILRTRQRRLEAR